MITGVSKLKEGPGKCKPILEGVMYLFWALVLTQILLMQVLIAFRWFNHVNLKALNPITDSSFNPNLRDYFPEDTIYIYIYIYTVDRNRET